MKKKKIIVSLIVLLLIIVGVVCKSRWDVWFDNPTELSYVANNQPSRVLLTFGNDGQQSRNISWQCDSVIKYGSVEIVKDNISDTVKITALSKLFKTKGGQSVYYWAKLRNLSFNAGYSYRVCVGDSKSAWYHFSMPNNATKDFSFVYFGDVQDTLQGKVKELFANVHHQYPKTDFYLFGGDLVERPMDCYWQEAFNSLDSIAQNTPIVAAPGNHEYIKGIINLIEDRFTYTFSYFVDSKYKDNDVYAFDYKDATIITLDSNRDFWYLFSQKTWLKNTLEKSTKKWKIVVLHHPIYSVRGKYNNLAVKTLFNSLLKEYGVDLVLQGHEHGYARMISKADNGSLTTPVYVVSHCSPKDYRLFFNDKYDRYGTNEKFYQNISISNDTLRVQAFTGDNKLYDDVCVVKQNKQTRVLDNTKGIPQKLEVPAYYKQRKPKDAVKYAREMQEWLNKSK